LSCLISPICSKLIKTFSDDAKLFLEIYRDPEIHDEYLTIYIRKNEYEKMILDRIDEAMSEFEPALGSASGWLLVTTDFMRPRFGLPLVGPHAGRAVRDCGAVARAGGIARQAIVQVGQEAGLDM
jgi:hypothetical protein